MYRRHLFGPSLPLLTRFDVSSGLLYTRRRQLQILVPAPAKSPELRQSPEEELHPAAGSQEASVGRPSGATQTSSTSTATQQVKGDVWTEDDFPSYPTNLVAGLPGMTPKLYKLFVKNNIGEKVPPQCVTDERLHNLGYRSWKDYVFQGKLANWD